MDKSPTFSWLVYGYSFPGCGDPHCPCHNTTYGDSVWERLRVNTPVDREYIVVE